MNKNKIKVLVVATSRKTRGGITSVIKAHETGEQWNINRCRWIETHRDGSAVRKFWYLGVALTTYICLLPFYDLVHIHVGLKVSVKRKMIFSKLAKWCKKPIIIHFHPSTEKHLFDKKYSKSICNLFMLSDKLIVLSNQWITWINEAYPNNNFKFEVLFNPCPKVTRRLENRKHQILFAGTLIKRKGYDKLIKGFAVVASEYPDWKLKFAGNGEIEEGKKLAKELNILSQVEFLGWVSGAEKEDAFLEASIYCLPSWGEGFPMGVLDAIAYGVPIVTTPVEGIPDLIKNGQNGYIFETNNINELVDKLTILMKSKERRKAIAQEADKLLKNEFNLERINQQLSLIYSSVLNGK